MPGDGEGLPEEGAGSLLRARCGATPHLSVEWDEGRATLELGLAPSPKPCFTRELVDSIIRVGRVARELSEGSPRSAPPAVRFVIVHSTSAGVFSAGGDLALIAAAAARGSEDELLEYGLAATRACHLLVDGLSCDALTVAAVDGMALGSGFEAAACCDVLVATPSSKFRLPEVEFGMHPGHGATSVMAHRTSGPTMARLMVDGEWMGAEEGAAHGIVDHVTRPGETALQGARRIVDGLAPRRAAAVAFHRGRRRALGMDLEAMTDETRRWARAAASLDGSSLERLSRIVAAQDRRFRAVGPVDGGRASPCP